MAKLKVRLLDKHTLVLDSDAKAGDTIDLNEINEVDLSSLETLFNNGLEQIYAKRIENEANRLRLEYQVKINQEEGKHQLIVKDLNNMIERLKNELASEVNKARNEIKLTYESQINALNLEITTLKTKLGDVEDKTRLSTINEYTLKINELKNQILVLENQAKLEKENLELSLNKKYNEEINRLNNLLNELKIQSEQTLNKTKNEYEAKIAVLERSKANLNVKNIGEDLEIWCDNEVKSYMQNGFDNCTWSKDNTVISDEVDTTASKGDYIFRIFTDNTHTFELASIMLEMKNEDPLSKNKKTNEDYYARLDKNRNKKGLKYALLVSSLESDNVNDIPMKRVLEYPDMYVVRPAYLLTFLNMIVSLTRKFASIINEKEEARIELLNQNELIEQFNALKATYLDKPLEALSNKIEEIKKQNDDIAKANVKINELCNWIINSYIEEIIKKLDKFDININREYKSFTKKVTSN